MKVDVMSIQKKCDVKENKYKNKRATNLKWFENKTAILRWSTWIKEIISQMQFEIETCQDCHEKNGSNPKTFY